MYFITQGSNLHAGQILLMIPPRLPLHVDDIFHFCVVGINVGELIDIVICDVNPR